MPVLCPSLTGRVVISKGNYGDSLLFPLSSTTPAVSRRAVAASVTERGRLEQFDRAGDRRLFVSAAAPTGPRKRNSGRVARSAASHRRGADQRPPLRGIAIMRGKVFASVCERRTSRPAEAGEAEAGETHEQQSPARRLGHGGGYGKRHQPELVAIYLLREGSECCRSSGGVSECAREQIEIALRFRKGPARRKYKQRFRSGQPIAWSGSGERATNRQ